MSFFPYSSAIKIPTVEGLHIIDAIDSRENCIIHLNNIQKKYNAIVEENKNLKSQVDLFTKNCVNNNNISTSNNCDVSTKKRVKEDGETQIILTESTQRGYELCKPFLNRSYQGNLKEHHKNNYNNIFEEIKKEGYPISLSENGAGETKISILSKEIALLIDGIDKNLFEYETTTKKKKFLSALCNVVTDFVSEMVYVEKILERLDRIVTDINNDEGFINILFEKFGITAGKREIGLIFKGGNVYKLYKTLLNNNLDKKVFANYLDEVEPFFKKSDCDFGLVLIVADENDNNKRFLHLDKNEELINTICSLQYMILNKYRNEFLSGDQRSFEHLSLCGKNDIIMSTKINEIGIKMMNIINENRTEYEQKLLRFLTDKISFDNRAYDKYLKYQPNRNETLMMVLEKATDIKDCNNNKTKPSYSIDGENIVEWYKFFLSIALNDPAIKFKSIFNGLRFDITFESNIIQELNKINTDAIDPRDIRSLYKVKQITNIVIGDHSYPITSEMVGETNSENDSNIYQKIMNNNDNITNNYTKTVAYRLRTLGRLHSNRNDFCIRFEKTNDGKNFLNVRSIPFDDNKSFITPFYISVNKDISSKIQKFAPSDGDVKKSDKNIEIWNINVKRLSSCGSSGYKCVGGNPYDDLRKIIEGKDIKDYNMFDFSLSRLMLSVVIVCKTFNGKYIVLPIPGEFIDLSYSYKLDYKTLLFEHYKGYARFNKSIDGYEYDKITKTYDEIIEYAKSDGYRNDLLSTKHFNQNELNDKQKETIDALVRVDNEILKGNITIMNKINNKIGLVSDNSENFFKMIKYYTKYGSSQSTLTRFINKTIYIPILSTYIMDLYAILFSDIEYPWYDIKYSKRLQRYIFFVFIEKMRTIFAENISLISSSNKTNNILDELGIKIMNDDPVKIFKEIMKINGVDKSYSSHNSFERVSSYLELRSKFALDNNIVQYDDSGKIIVSASGIDRFMFGYHLLDFLDIRSGDDNMFRRCQFIIPNNGAYILVTLSGAEIENNSGGNIFNNLSEQEFDKDIEEDPISKNTYKRYQKITHNSEDLKSKELYKYIKYIEHIREKLIITVANFSYNYAMGDKLAVVSDDTMSIMLNLYDGDINRILTVM